MRRYPRHARAYTVIEVILAISILAIASAGVLALHVVSSSGNMRARDTAVATQIAQMWAERLRADAAGWNYPSPAYANVPSNLNQTTWLRIINTTPRKWVRPPDVVGRGSAAFDLLGNDLPVGGWQAAAFCTNIRLTWLYPPQPAGGTATYAQLMRADIRVFWPRDHALTSGNPAPILPSLCDPGADYTVFDTPTAPPYPYERYHFVYLTVDIQENVAL